MTSWISDGVDFLHNDFLGGYDDFRLVPTQLTYDENGMTYYSYRVEYRSNQGVPITNEFWSEINDWWLQVDNYIYNGLATDNLVIGFDADGVVQSVQPLALRTTLYRA